MKHVCSLVLRHGLLVVVLFFVAGKAARAQAPAWQAAVAGNGTNATSYVKATAADGSGNVYVAGYFTGTLVLGTIGLTSVGGTDGFVAKWSGATGAFVWAQRLGGAGADDVSGVAVSGTSVYVAGTFNGTATFGATTLVSAGRSDAFVAKLTDAGPGGAFVWTRRAGGTGDDYATAVAANGPLVYVAGTFSGTASFGSIFLVSGGFADLFVTRLTDAGASGGFDWASRAGGSSAIASTGASTVAVNGASVYVAGAFDLNATFGTTVLSTFLSNGFVAKLTDAGTGAAFVWALRVAVGNMATSGVNGVAVSGTSVYATGTFSGTASLGAVSLVSAGGSDAFVAKINDAGGTGGFFWAQRAGGAGSDIGYGVAARGPSVYATGAFSGTASFGSAGTPLLVSAGNLDVFVVKLTDAGLGGSVAWAQRAGGVGEDRGYGVALGGQNVYAAGLLNPPASVGGFFFAGPVADVGFLGSLRDPTLSTTAPPLAMVRFELTPNPAHGTATVQLPAVPGAAQATLTLLDALGRTVRTQLVPLPAAGATAEVPLAGLAPGLYRLRVQAGGQRASSALAVE